jgi:hypothetical protein
MSEFVKGKFKGKRVLDQFHKLLAKYRHHDPDPFILLHTSSRHIQILECVMSFANQETFLTYPAVPTIMYRCKLADSTVRLYLKELIQQGWLENAGKKRFVCGNGWKQFINQYKVTLAEGESRLVSLYEKTSSERRISAKVSAESHPKVSAESRGLTCTSYKSLSCVSETLTQTLNLVEAREQATAGLSKSLEETRKTEEQNPPLTPEENSILTYCYKLSAIPLPTCFSSNEHRLLQDLLTRYTPQELLALLNYAATLGFWISRFIIDRNGKPVTHPVHYFHESADTLNKQNKFHLKMQTRRTKTPATTSVSTGAPGGGRSTYGNRTITGRSPDDAQALHQQFSAEEIEWANQNIAEYKEEFRIYRKDCECRGAGHFDDCDFCSAKQHELEVAHYLVAADTENENELLSEDEMAFHEDD